MVVNMSELLEASQEGDIEVGETGDTLRLWAAKESMRHGELHLASQAASLTAMEGRATSILGWAVAGVFGLGALSTTGSYRAAASLAAFSLFVSAFSCVVGLWPQDWAVAGMLPKQLRNSGQNSELEILEYIAKGYDEAISLNSGRLESLGHCLVLSWVCFVASPILAAVTAYLITVMS